MLDASIVTIGIDNVRTTLAYDAWWAGLASNLDGGGMIRNCTPS